MGLKSMHAEKQSEQPQQSVQDNSLIEQQSQRITELEHQISELSSINSTLMSELRVYIIIFVLLASVVLHLVSDRKEDAR